uniref:DUF305 domain-containing protein n=1 Tax=viral metagenome TaxID=1070528 RepID=A0A6C0J819_9ZZZZ
MSHKKEICRGKLTVKKYLKHMIKHHQVAIDISIHMQKISKWDRLQDLLRKIVWSQSWDIEYMKILVHQPPENISKMGKNAPWLTVGTTTSPNVKGFTNALCDPMFFDPIAHKKHFSHMNLTDKYYIDHMIPHHQVAVDMSKRILENSDNDTIFYLANRIIKSQEGEIIYLTNLKKGYKNKSTLIL